MPRRRGWMVICAGVLTAGCLLGGSSAAPRRPSAPTAPAKGPAAPTEADRFFETRIRPLLVARCYSCHSAASSPVQGAFRLDSRAALLAGGPRGAALVPGDPDRGSFIRAVRYADQSLQMPPGGKLPESEIAALVAWVRLGAPWPSGPVPSSEFRVPSSGNGEPGTRKPKPAQPHWAWVPPRVPALPPVKDRAWVKTPIDAFVLAKLEAKGLRPAPPADPRTLIRRATFDLTGLPPTPEEVEAFVRECAAERASGTPPGGGAAQAANGHGDNRATRVPRRESSLGAAPAAPPGGTLPARYPAGRRNLLPDAGPRQSSAPGDTPQALTPNPQPPTATAYERLIDRLLASPAYGERWGRHWLDVARYADSNGLDENLVYANAWRYRDYVIRSFNADKPIDRFFQEQIAGDLLAKDEEIHPSSFIPHPSAFDPIIATGFLSLGPKMLAEDDPVKQEEDIIDEQVDTLGKTFMGLTLGCARCHDHKFDPFPQTDYYALAGIFKSTRTMQNFRVVAEWQEVPLASREEQAKLAEIEKTLAGHRAEQDRLRKTEGERVLAEARRSLPRYASAAREVIGLASAPALRPVVGPGGDPAPPGAVVLEAEEFRRGNVLKDREHYGKGIGVLVNAGQYPNLTEYEVTLPQAGPYQLDLRYASGDARPIRVYVNDALVLSGAAGKTTGGFFPGDQQWFAEGVFLFRAGANRIRLERDSYFPHLDRLLLLPRPGQPATRTPGHVAAENGLVPEFLSQAVRQLKADSGAALTFELPPDPAPLLPAGAQADLRRLGDEIAALEKTKPALPRAMAVSEGTPATMRVHLRGSYLTLGQECARRFPAVLAGETPPIAPDHSGRLELALWLTRPGHPLTARVFVNRVWRWHFGRGIVPSTDNFGTLGERPSHPELLDYLATYFVSGVRGQGPGVGGHRETGLSPAPSPQPPAPGAGWSLKRLHRLIVLSATYRQSAEQGTRNEKQGTTLDPENSLLWHFPRRRLEGEEIRDAILAVSGQLDRTMGGTLLTFRDRQYVTSTANADPVNYRSNRRSVYLPVIRSALYDVFTTFDFGDPSVLNGDRPTTTVAPQALFMMNSPVVLEATKAMAAGLLARPGLEDVARLRIAYETCYGRSPAEAEVRQALEFLARVDQASASREPDPERRRQRAWQSLCKALIGAAEFIYVE